jgi:hypothetical protein
MAWIGTLPCAVCKALGVVQTTRTEVEHFVLRSHGGYDKGDCYPTCGAHREMRHGTMGPKAFTRMLQAQGFDERKLCDKLAKLYGVEQSPCP